LRGYANAWWHQPVCSRKYILGEVYGDGIALITVQTTLRWMLMISDQLMIMQMATNCSAKIRTTQPTKSQQK